MNRNIYQRILEVMRKVQYIQKDAQIQFGNTKYKAVTHDKVIASIRPALIENEIVIVPSVIEHSCEQLKVGSNNAFKTDVKISVNFINANDPQDRYEVFSFGSALDNQDKGIGKAISYALKYAILKTFCIETGENEESRMQGEIEQMPSFYSDHIMQVGSFKGQRLDAIAKNKILNHFLKFNDKYNDADKQAVLNAYPELMEEI